jgi:hypothetical protein
MLHRPPQQRLKITPPKNWKTKQQAPPKTQPRTARGNRDDGRAAT